jgi:glycosyltransferase involved in cell wall biosynthesis
VDLYIANSWSTASLMKEAGFWPVRVVKLGVSVPPTPASRARQSRAQEGPYLLFVGRLVPRKGAAWFVERVLPLLPAEVRLKLAGVAWDGAELAAIQRLPRARWLGPVSKERLADLYAGSVATVMPNMPTEDGDDVEGFGLVALEAAAHGSVPIAARLQGLEDAVRHGENGFLVQPGQPGAWRRAIMEVLQWSAEDRRRFTCRARRTLERHYTWDRVAERTEEAYRAGINSRDPHGID